MRFFRLIVGTLFILMSWPCLAQQLEFQVKLEQPRYKLGEPVLCKMILTNRGDTPVWVNQRFLVNWPGAFPHEVYFRITDRQGRLLPFQLLMRAGDPEVSDFKQLLPGQLVQGKCDLNQSYPLGAGSYRVEAIYENHQQPSSVPSSWQGRLRSQPAELVVE